MQESTYLRQARKDESVANLLARLKMHDARTYVHSLNVAYLMDSLLYYFSFDENPTEILKGALLHDIGKLDIPQEIINKPDALNKEELMMMMRHPSAGIKYLVNESVTVRNMCLLHHEKLDGTGYPQGLPKGMIEDYCQLLAIVDIIIALCEQRKYRKARETYDELEAEFLRADTFLKLNKTYYEKVLELIKNDETYLLLEKKIS